MTLSDADLPPRVAHQRELEAWRDRSVPGHLLSTRDLSRRTEADDREALRLRYEERSECESVDAEEAHWEGVAAAMPEWMRDVHFRTRTGIDPRLWGA